jgi:hypothetical protein
MNEIKELLNQNWVGAAIGIGGIIIGIVFAYSFRPRSRLAAQANTLQLAGPNAVFPDDLEFLFKGHKVPNVTLSRVAIWNIGNTTLKGDQITTSDPLRIVTSNGSVILETTIRACTRKVNDFSCSLRFGVSNEVECRFDYLDPGDGALIQLIHTGNETVSVTGTLRGMPKRVLNITPTPKKKPEPQSQLSPFAARLMAVTFLIIGISLSIARLARLFSPDAAQLSSAFSIVSIVFGLLFLLWGRYIPPNQLGTQISNYPPKGKSTN